MVVETEFYTLLDVLPNATDDEILKSYRNLARIYHPDRNPDGVDKFQEISEAYKVLSDPDMVSHSKTEINHLGVPSKLKHFSESKFAYLFFVGEGGGVQE